MAGQDRQQSDDMLRRIMQQQHLEVQRRLILQQPKEKCPRCNSMDTKFVYFNNLKETQPRYHCKGCRRFWTKGGQLRNVPVGGGVRPPRASFSGGGLIMRPVTSQPFLVGSAERSHFNGGPRPQAPFSNIQPQYNVAANVQNSSTAAWQAPNQGLRQLHHSVDNINPMSSTGGSFSAWQAPNQGMRQLQHSSDNISPMGGAGGSFSAWQAPNQGLRQLQHPVDNINLMGGTGGSFSDWQAPNQGLRQLQHSVDNINPMGSTGGNFYAWQAPNQGLRQLQHSLNNINQIGGACGSFSDWPSYIDWSSHFPGNGPAA